MDEGSPRYVPTALLALWALAVASITLSPGAPLHPSQQVSSWCLICGSRGTADAILNVVLFLPLGGLLRPLAGPVWGVVAGVVVSAGIEIAQRWIPGRYPTAGDVVWNVTGAVLGLVLAGWVGRAVHRTAPRTRSLVLALVLPSVYLAGSAFLLQPRETDARYFGQWTPDLAYMPPYEGEVRAATSNLGDVPNGPWPAGRGLHTAPSWWVESEVSIGPAPEAVAPIVSVYDGDQEEIWLLGALGDDLVWRERSWAAILRFDRPDLRVPGALRGLAAGEVATLGSAGQGADRCLRVGDREVCGLGVSPGRTWGMLLYLEGTSLGQRRVLDAAWMATLFLLIGVVGGARRTTVVTAGLAGAVVLSLVVATRLTAPAPVEWIGLVVGVLAGVGLRRPLRAVLGAEGHHRTEDTLG